MMQDLSLPAVNQPKLRKCVRISQEIRLHKIPSRVRAPPAPPLSSREVDEQRQREKTFTETTTELGKALERLYDRKVHVLQEQKIQVLDIVENFIGSIRKRISTNRHNLKFGDPIITGGFLNGIYTQEDFKDLDVYLPIKVKELRTKQVTGGGCLVMMSRNSRYDRFQTLRSDRLSTEISSERVEEAIWDIISHVSLSTGQGMATKCIINNNVLLSPGSQTITQVQLQNGITVKIHPCIWPKEKINDSSFTSMLLVTTPNCFSHTRNERSAWWYKSIILT